MAIEIKTFEIYYETMLEAICAAKEYADNKGWTVNSIIGEQWKDMQKETYQTKLYKLHRSGRASDQCMNIILYRTSSGRYELTTYIK
jgi:hypothetical protein